ncbi:MAG: type I restriction enzyme endonuclease domain-containing protein [Cyanobium sp.]
MCSPSADGEPPAGPARCAWPQPGRGVKSPPGSRRGELDHSIDLSQIDFQTLARRFQQKKHKKTELDELKALIAAHLARMVQLNPTRANYLEKFEAFIAAYNSGSRSVEGTYRELLRLSQELSQEEKRHIRENLSEEELAVFDIFLQTAPELSESERSKVKQSAKELVQRVKDLLVLNWQQNSMCEQAYPCDQEETGEDKPNCQV